MAAFFLLLGLAVIAARRLFAGVSAYFALKRPQGAFCRRLTAAVRRREAREALPTSVMGMIVGGSSLALAAVTAFTRTSVTLLYTFLALVLALTLFAGYLRLRRATGRRTASLRKREPDTVVPSFVYALVAVAVVMPLSWLPTAPAGALLATAAGLIIALIGWGVAAMPALLTGDDAVVEQYVDDRLRSGRTINLLGTAVAPGFFFMALTRYTDSPLHVAALLVSLTALLVACTLHFGMLLRGPSSADLERWAQFGGDPSPRGAAP